jgi:hypothetical protein
LKRHRGIDLKVDRRRRRLGRDKMGRLNNLEGGRRRDNEKGGNEIWN